VWIVHKGHDYFHPSLSHVIWASSESDKLVPHKRHASISGGLYISICHGNYNINIVQKLLQIKIKLTLYTYISFFMEVTRFWINSILSTKLSRLILCGLLSAFRRTIVFPALMFVINVTIEFAIDKMNAFSWWWRLKINTTMSITLKCIIINPIIITNPMADFT